MLTIGFVSLYGRWDHTFAGSGANAGQLGALLKFPIPLAVNIALKKVRDGLWSCPHQMPPDWRLRRALPETCLVAGGS